MISFFIDFLTCLSALVRSRYNLGLEIIALRQQLERKIPRPELRDSRGGRLGLRAPARFEAIH